MTLLLECWSSSISFCHQLHQDVIQRLLRLQRNSENATVTSAAPNNIYSNEPGPRQARHSNRQTAVALYDYEARSGEDLSFKKGHHFEVINDTQGLWWYSINKSTQMHGYIPSNFVKKLKSIKDER